MSSPTGDPIVDGVIGLVESLISEGVHALDPETRAQTIRDRVEAERAKWTELAAAPTSTQRSDEITRRHHVEKDDPKP